MEHKLSFKERVKNSLIPQKYPALANQPITRSIIHFLTILFISYVIMFMLFIPALLSLKSDIESELGKFDEMNGSIQYTLNQPASITLPISKQKITVEPNDSTRTVRKDDEMVLITQEQMTYKFFPTSTPKKIVREKYADLAQKDGDVSTFFFLIFLMMIPSILILGYLILLIYYGLIAFLVGSIVFIIARTIKFEVSFLKVMNISLYASIFMIFLGLITWPFIDIYYINYVLFIAVIILAVKTNGRFEKAYGNEHHNPWAKR